jgi:hypothetical protein
MVDKENTFQYGGHVARMVKLKEHREFLLLSPHRSTLAVKPRHICRWEEKIKIDLGEVGFRGKCDKN